MYHVSLSLLSVILIVASRLRTDVFAGTSWKRALVFRYRCLFHFHFVSQLPRWASKCILSPQLCGSSRFVNIFPLFAVRVVLPSFACRRCVSTSFVAVFRLYRLCAVFVLRYVTRKRCILCVATVICVFYPGLNVHQIIILIYINTSLCISNYISVKLNFSVDRCVSLILVYR